MQAPSYCPLCREMAWLRLAVPGDCAELNTRGSEPAIIGTVGLGDRPKSGGRTMTEGPGPSFGRRLNASKRSSFVAIATCRNGDRRPVSAGSQLRLCACMLRRPSSEWRIYLRLRCATGFSPARSDVQPFGRQDCCPCRVPIRLIGLRIDRDRLHRYRGRAHFRFCRRARTPFPARPPLLHETPSGYRRAL
jgi:hypothetical protein